MQDSVHLSCGVDAATTAIGPECALNPDDLPLIKEFVAEANGHVDAAEAELLRLEQDSHDAEAINAVFRSFHTIKGVAGFFKLSQIGALAQVAEAVLDLARRRELEISGEAANIVLEAADAMRSLIRELADAAERGTPIPVHPGLSDLVERLRSLAECCAGEHRGQVAGTQSVLNSSAAQARRNDVNADQVIKVSTERLDSLINMVGELVIAESMVSQNIAASSAGNQRLSRNLRQLEKITRQLQELSMAMRMVPIRGVFQKATRLVRDLAQKGGKQVEVVVSGAETEVDRNVIAAIGDPLVHMVRNAVDHGIELPADRQRAGKPRCGRIELRAQHKAGSVHIEISDDGRGLHKQRILKKAAEADLVREGDELSEQDVFRLIFHPGLSTAEQVTDVSGRGVGMDVVKRNIESLRGQIEVASAEGQGTTFGIRLPLTLAVIDGLLIGIGTERYILPILSIEQSLRPTAQQLSTVQGRGEMCLVRGKPLPVLRLHRLFGVKPLTEDPTQSLLVIVRDNQRSCCLLVDELFGQQQVVIKTLDQSTGQVTGVSGAAILGDGNVSLILDVSSIAALAYMHRAA